MARSPLRYVSTEEEGYTRKKWGRGFTYRDPDGNTVTDDALRQWIESIAIPPAWTDVWISPYKNGHILATGRDDKNRKQYCYHPRWQEMQNETKFDRLAQFGKCLPMIRKVTDAHLRKHKLSRQRVLAGLVRLLESTLIRIGNTEYAKNNDSFGLTTLTDDHAEIEGNKIIFEFVGKSGQEHSIVLRDARLARIVKRCRDIPGYDLFQYYDDDGTRRTVGSGDVNAYLKQITGEDFTAKDFRTWGGSTLAIKYLCEQCRDQPSERATLDCVDHVANLLGNTTAVCRKYYIHPRIMEAYEDGRLQTIYEAAPQPESDYDLSPEETTLIRLVEQSN